MPLPIFVNKLNTKLAENSPSITEGIIQREIKISSQFHLWFVGVELMCAITP